MNIHFHQGHTDAVGHVVHKEYQHTHFLYVKKYEIEDLDKEYRFGHAKCDYRAQLDYVNKVRNFLLFHSGVHAFQMGLFGHFNQCCHFWNCYWHQK